MTEPETTQQQATRSIEQEVEVVGTPEQVWNAIATGPGITAWFVPTEVTGEVGGVVRQSFGPGPEMQVEGRVRAWDPPRRFAFAEHAEGDEGMAFEFLVEARDEASCTVRLVNSGFKYGEEWDAQYDGMDSGWRLFLHNLQLHLELFAGQQATSLMATGMAVGRGGREQVWRELAERLEIDPSPTSGSRITVGVGAPAPMSGVVRQAPLGMVSIVLDEPASGTGFFAIEGTGDMVSVSIWMYLYGEAGAAAAARDEPRWQGWLAESYPMPAYEPPVDAPAGA
jgi:uncharacterized protein YndB with AHSA1/START domain